MGIKEQELVIAKLTEKVNATKSVHLYVIANCRAFLEELRKIQPETLRNGHAEDEPMDLDPKIEES